MYAVVSTTYIQNADGTLSRQTQYIVDYFGDRNAAVVAIREHGEISYYIGGEVETWTLEEVE